MAEAADPVTRDAIVFLERALDKAREQRHRLLWNSFTGLCTEAEYVQQNILVASIEARLEVATTQYKAEKAIRKAQKQELAELKALKRIERETEQQERAAKARDIAERKRLERAKREFKVRQERAAYSADEAVEEDIQPPSLPVDVTEVEAFPQYADHAFTQHLQRQADNLVSWNYFSIGSSRRARMSRRYEGFSHHV